MVDETTREYGMVALDCYLATIKVIRALTVTKKEIIPDYGGLVKSVLSGLIQIKDAFTSREFLRDYLDCDISDERIEEFEDFLEGRRNELSGLDEDIKKLDNLYNSLKFIN